ncbi:DDE-type integrase/transposase/recombinase [Bacillus cereus]|nr:DDE-type integrase/transposase/recombinase [Bacillus thuringiensis]MEC2866762.1 DDE-type integrase/transposase/recombinase [Bacillus cereus]
MYLYPTFDSKGYTINFYLCKSRNHKDAKRFFTKALPSFHPSRPRAITVDKKHCCYHRIEEREKDVIRYLNPADKISKCIVEPDNRFNQKRILSMLSLRTCLKSMV